MRTCHRPPVVQRRLWNSADDNERRMPVTLTSGVGVGNWRPEATYDVAALIATHYDD